MRFKTFFLFSFFLVFVAGCQKNAIQFPEHGRAILVTNSTFESAAREFLEAESLLVARLSEPGTCPGHFDIQPSQALLIKQCPVVVRFEFQASLDSKIRGVAQGKDKKIVVIADQPGLCLPETYLNICRQIGQLLADEGWISAQAYRAQLEVIQLRLAELSEEIHDQIKARNLNGVSVLASPHQQVFSEWLGLDVPATFSNSDHFTINNLLESFQKGSAANISIIISNEPEGRRVADLLAEKLKVPVVVFGNFPQLKGTHPFDELLKKNLTQLLSAV
ncbi:MAG: hypothetical protein QM428_09510 [Verrucomicrobiota bacterium]|nr:hypothetical protein [Verrucomicrobiota bacterium]